MKPIRVLHVFNCFKQGGIENFVMNLYRNIDKKSIQFDFAFLSKEGKVFDEEVKNLGGNIYYFDSEEKTLSNFKSSLKRIIKTNGPYEVIHSHIYFFSGYVLKIAKQCNVPIRIAHSHETQKGRKNTIIRKIYESYMRHLINRNATKKLCCSDAAGRHLFKKNYNIVYNGIDLCRFRYDDDVRHKIRAEYGLENYSVYLNVGRFADQKNHMFLLDVFEKIKIDNKNSKLILIGDGELFDDINLQINKRKLNNDILIFSNVKNPEFFYNASDVFLLPSKYEGLGIVAVEAQANGLTCLLSSKVPYEVRIQSNCYFVDIDSPDKWVDALKKTEEINRSNAVIYLENSPFDINYTVNKITKIYKGNKNYEQ